MDQSEEQSLAKIQIESSWKQKLRKEFFSPYFQQIKHFLESEKQKGQLVYPPGKWIFNAYNFCLLYTSDAADERSSVDLGGRRIIKKKKYKRYSGQRYI